MRNRLLGLAAGGMLGFGALTYSGGTSLASFDDRSPEAAYRWDLEERLQKIKDTYAGLSPLERLREGPDFLERYNAMLKERHRLDEIPAVREGLKERQRHAYQILFGSLMTLFSSMAAVLAFWPQEKEAKE